ncbi:hypothetical protein AAG570_010233 [Ranatra chinensis]|uniref:Major facilitator superfamily (MFS) profile domain-containing protein n=1 Tax=Ranatra chinensis TaxID=642074 RepID=A0ABD0YMC5_9HEMI
MAYKCRNMFENTKRETKEIGYGKFNYLVIIGVGLQRFSCLASVLIMSFVVSSIGCDFRLTPAQKGTLTSILFVGMVSSSHLNGFLSDRYGRRYTTLRCSALCCIISCAASFAFNYTMLVILWFFMGFFLAGVITPVLVYVSEFSPPKHRRKTIFMSVALAALATTYDPCVAWLIIPLEIRWTLWPGMVFTSWRLLLLWNSVPFLAAWLLLLALPESPKYLLTRGKDQETIRALARAFAMNTGQDKADYPIKEVGLDGGDSLADDDGGSVAGFFVSMWRQTRMLFTPPLLLHTLLCCSIQVGVVGT